MFLTDGRSDRQIDMTIYRGRAAIQTKNTILDMSIFALNLYNSINDKQKINNLFIIKYFLPSSNNIVLSNNKL